MKFSSRTEWDVTEIEFTAKVREARAARLAQGSDLLDLTVSNPTACGFTYDEASLLQALGEPAAMLYQPEPFGMLSAREAVAKYYRSAVHPAHICLTTSTSEAYSFVFRLLCDPGDEVLVATPSYPLFDFIASLDDVRLVPYSLLYHDGWFIDMHSLRAAITERTRAVIVVHPNNPTGSYCSAAERASLQSICAERGVALIVDEVFLDYALRPESVEPGFLSEQAAALTFVLSGISKVCGLPQMKCSWIAVAGPEQDVATAVSRLEVIADTFLSMNAPIQHALPGWLAARRNLQSQIVARTVDSLAQLDVALAGTACERLATDAGWCCVVRVPRHVEGVSFAEALLGEGVLVQPGDFYGLSAGYVVLSLLTLPAVWRCGLEVIRKLTSDQEGIAPRFVADGRLSAVAGDDDRLSR